MKLVDNWRDAPRWLSIQLSALGAAGVIAWQMLPTRLQDALVDRFDGLEWIVGLAMFIAIMVGRVVDQSHGA
jgi:hypothetical protein